MIASELIPIEEIDVETAHAVSLICDNVQLKIARETGESLQTVHPNGTSYVDKDIEYDKERVPLGPGDIQRMVLAPNGWLNDHMINRAMNFVNMDHPLQWKDDQTIEWSDWKATTLSTVQSTMIKNGQYDLPWMTEWMKDQGMTKGEQPQLNCVMIPWFVNRNHWILTAIFPWHHKIAILDSFVRGKIVDRVTVYNHICKWLHAYMEDDFDDQEWNLLQLSCPQQRNSSDCGIHAALNAWLLSKRIWPMAHKDITPADRREFVAGMVRKGTEDGPVATRRVL